ncbi:hypothetical protein RRF57_002034 [Xylaria bambusicola]|uniref:Uncharacterized protein n=1 Tax=Xylaria bambusicola TaxID=326684 RepID=A0AAN7UCE7_9PEZI
MQSLTSDVLVPTPNEDRSVPAPIDWGCVLGIIPPYVVNVTSMAQVAEAVKLRLRIKNRSLLLSLKAANAETMVTIYTSKDLLSPSMASVSTVGIPFDAHRLSTASLEDLLQIEVVTADGEVELADACQNTDPFRALCGGAGAADCKDYDSYSRLIKSVVDDTVALHDSGRYEEPFWRTRPKDNRVFGSPPVTSWACSLSTLFPFKAKSIRNAEEALGEAHTVVIVDGCTPVLKAAQFTGAASWNDAYEGVV